MEEIWREIPGFEGYYQASSFGRVKSVDRTIIDSRGVSYLKKGKVLKQGLRKDGYYQVVLSKDSITKSYSVHRLVYSAFFGEIPFDKEINHIDEDTTNNKLENLNLLSHKSNLNWGSAKERLSENKKKPVKQFSVNGELIKSFQSTVSASSETGISQGNISSCCLGKLKTAGGFIWKYAC